MAALSGYSLSIRSPAIELLPEAEQDALWKIVETRYREVKTVSNFGQGFTTLRVMVRKSPAESAGVAR